MSAEPAGNRPAPPQMLASGPGGRVLLFDFAAGQAVPMHRHPGAQVVLALLSGQLEVEGQSGRLLNAGEFMVHDGEHDIGLLARQPSRVLVSLLTRSS